MSKNFLSIYAKSFNWAGFFLPKKTYQDCSDLYDFCRTLDDIADQDLDLRIKKKIFEEFKRDFESKNIENPIINKIYKLIEDFEISPKIISDLFDLFIEEPSLMPGNWNRFINDKQKFINVCDYISGMTDNYAINTHRKFFDLYSF